MATYLQQKEREYFARKSGTNNPQVGLNQLKRDYFSVQLGNVNPQTPLNELETRWQVKVIRDAGNTPSDEHSPATLWKEVVIAIGQIPQPSFNANKILFYIHAP